MAKERNLILPGNPRYQPKEMIPFFGYDNLYQKIAEVEIATLQVLGEIGVIPEKELDRLTPSLIRKIIEIPTTEVDKIEKEITHHDIRAWVKKAKEITNQGIARWIHIPLTSYDVIDTGRVLQFKDAYQQALKPSIKEVVFLLSNLVRKFSGELQIGRTHGQHALPITVGFWLATILNRIVYNWQQMDFYCKNLSGKISGAVGAYNAQTGLGFLDLCGNEDFEKRVLRKLGLNPAAISTQVLPPEPLGYFLFSCAMISAAFAQFGRDCRHLMRSEIAEVSESFEKGQVGSSTMAHKRNPVNFENLEGMWLKTKNEFGKVMDTLISEHQRDLVGSSISRDFPIILINLQQQLNTLLKKNESGISFLDRININKDACRRNFAESSHLILAEPLYIALQIAGYQGDAHDLVNHKLVPKAAKTQLPLIEILEEFAKKDPDLKSAISKIPKKLWESLRCPEKYTGNAKRKALEIADYAQKTIDNLNL